MTMTYADKFRACLVTRLGGVEMAEEFFLNHPTLFVKMRMAGLYHRTKGGAAWKGAKIFFEQTVKPILAADRKLAMSIPPGTLDDYLDGRN